jgi:tetratricopeptide (TPR) repeat protein
MAIREKCLYCGEPVSQNGYCTSCKLSQSFLKRAFNTSNYHYNIGLEKAKIHDLSGAIESLKTSLRYNKMNISCRNLLGLVYYEMGETVPALSQWVLSVNYQAEQNPAVRYLKEVRDDPKELERASEVAREFNQALEHAKQHSFDLAQIALRKAVSMNRNFVKGHLLMALIYSEQGRMGMAKKCLTKVLSIDRTNLTAQRYLREMGESEEKIVRMAEQGEDSEDLFDNYYGVETPEGQRPARKIEPKTVTGKRTSVTVMKRFKESNMARYSNVYMFAGIVIGMLILYFLVVPGIRKRAEADKELQESSYLKELSAKNSEIASMQLTIEENEKAVKQKDQEKEGLQKQITSLRAQLDAVRNQIASGGAALLPEKKSGETEGQDGEEGQDETQQDEENTPEDGEDGDGEDGDGEGDAEAGDDRARRADTAAETVQEGIRASELEAMIANE